MTSFANHVMGQYARHFSGRDRLGRDAGLLQELIIDLSWVRGEMLHGEPRGIEHTLQADLGVLDRNLSVYSDELVAIDDTFLSSPIEQQGEVLARRANAQFLLYQDHFAGRQRVSRRPALLQRIIGQLRTIESAMTGLRTQGLAGAAWQRNLEVVRQGISCYETELAQIHRLRQTTPRASLVLCIFAEANEIFEEDAQDRLEEGRPARLGLRCDRVGELMRQLRDLYADGWCREEQRNMDVVAFQLESLEEEWAELCCRSG